MLQLCARRNVRQTLLVSSVDSIKRHGTSIAVILLQNVSNYGTPGDIVKVKRGYARNMLIPRSMAAYATPENKQKFETLIKSKNDTSSSSSSSGFVPPTPIADDTSSGKHLQDHEIVTFSRSVVSNSKDGSLYGSVTIQDILTQLNSSGYASVDVNDIELTTPIKSLGDHIVTIKSKSVIIRVIVEETK